MTVFEISIDRLAFGGGGVGRYDGKVCFVPYSCPGDYLKVSLTTDKRSYSTASIAEIVKPSSDRVEPPCPLFGSCGGCNWQHIAYTRQLISKREIFADTLWRGARVNGDLIADVVPSAQNYGYRSRVQFKLHYAKSRLKIGFYRQETHVVEDAADGCPVAMPVINDSLSSFRSVLKKFPDPRQLSQINIDCAGSGVIAVVNYIGNDIDGVAGFFKKHMSELSPVTGLYLQSGKKVALRKVYGDDLLTYILPGKLGKQYQLSYKPGGFSQVNREQNIQLLELVRHFLEFKGTEQVLDLYCGNGNFSIPLAGDVFSMTGIEEYKDSISSAVENAVKNGITNSEFISADAVAGVRKLVELGRKFDVVILDPPRSGAGDAVVEILKLNPDKIVYISCDPSTLARDCAAFVNSGQYQVKNSIPVDMFPQTYHLESVTLLVREK